MAFRIAGRIGIVEGLPQCQPVLLEPIHQVEIVCPSEATAKINAILSSRRGQILGFDAREGWPGWDVVRAQMPEAEIGDLIIEVRSATAGVGSFTFKFDHMAGADRAHRRPDHRGAGRRRSNFQTRSGCARRQRTQARAPGSRGTGARHSVVLREDGLPGPAPAMTGK